MSASTKSILIVDDDADIRSNLQDIFCDLGYRVDSAEDGHAALELVALGSYDVVLLDFQMPGMNGASLYREIKQLRPEIVAIMITAYAGSDGMQQALDAGTWKVLRKPVDVSKLVPMVEEASEQPLVLVVDDDEDFCESFWQVLREAGFRVSIAHTESEGVAFAENYDFQVAVVDLRLSSGDGLEVMTAILTKKRPAHVILITGHRNEYAEQISEIANFGVATQFKPLDMHHMTQLLRTASI